VIPIGKDADIDSSTPSACSIG